MKMDFTVKILRDTEHSAPANSRYLSTNLHYNSCPFPGHKTTGLLIFDSTMPRRAQDVSVVKVDATTGEVIESSGAAASAQDADTPSVPAETIWTDNVVGPICRQILRWYLAYAVRRAMSDEVLEDREPLPDAFAGIEDAFRLVDAVTFGNLTYEPPRRALAEGLKKAEGRSLPEPLPDSRPPPLAILSEIHQTLFIFGHHHVKTLIATVFLDRIEQCKPGSAEAMLLFDVADYALRIAAPLTDTKPTRKRFSNDPDFVLRVIEMGSVAFEDVIGTKAAINIEKQGGMPASKQRDLFEFGTVGRSLFFLPLVIHDNPNAIGKVDQHRLRRALRRLITSAFDFEDRRAKTMDPTNSFPNAVRFGTKAVDIAFRLGFWELGPDLPGIQKQWYQDQLKMERDAYRDFGDNPITCDFCGRSCHIVFFCSAEHQLHSWRAGHRLGCGKENCRVSGIDVDSGQFFWGMYVTGTRFDKYRNRSPEEEDEEDQEDKDGEGDEDGGTAAA